MDKQSPFNKPLTYDGGKKFASMTHVQKWIFVTKLVICVATFGFAFPNIQND
jgi:hypothetical protein